MIARNLVIASLAATVALLGAVGSAEAGRRHGGFGLKFGGGGFHKHHHHFHHRHFYGPRIVIGGGGCGYYWNKWKWTGSYYWKAKYYDCVS